MGMNMMPLEDALHRADTNPYNGPERALAAEVRRQREEIEQLRTRAELLLSGEPVAWVDADGDVYKEEPTENWCPPHTPLYLHPAPDSDTVRNTGRKFSDEDLAEIHQLAYQLGGTDNGEYQLDGDELEQVVVKCAFLFYSNSAPDTVLDAEVGAAIQKAAASLPDGYTVVITVEAGAATVELCDGSGNTSVMDVDDDNRLAAEIVAAIDAARGAK